MISIREVQMLSDYAKLFKRKYYLTIPMNTGKTNLPSLQKVTTSYHPLLPVVKC